MDPYGLSFISIGFSALVLGLLLLMDPYGLGFISIGFWALVLGFGKGFISIGFWALVLGLMFHFIVALGIEPSTLDIKLETISVASGFHEFGYYYYYDYDYDYYYYYYYDYYIEGPIKNK